MPRRAFNDLCEAEGQLDLGEYAMTLDGESDFACDETALQAVEGALAKLRRVLEIAQERLSRRDERLWTAVLSCGMAVVLDDSDDEGNSRVEALLCRKEDDLPICRNVAHQY